MIQKTIPLKESYPFLSPSVTLTAYVPSYFEEMKYRFPMKALLILPGGAYNYCSRREGEPVAMRFAGEGVACFVLEYSTVNNKDTKVEFPFPLVDALAALHYIQHHAAEFHVDPKQVSVIGFSAGGHLAASLAAHYQEKDVLDYLGLSSIQPIDTLLLAYPVITAFEATHEVTIANVLTDHPELREYFSLERQVTPGFPRTFLWTTLTDEAVPPISTLLMDKALEEAGVEHQTILYPHGHHGLSLANELVIPPDVYKAHPEFHNVSDWVNQALSFLKKER